jgi:hypothetical protein
MVTASIEEWEGGRRREERHIKREAEDTELPRYVPFQQKTETSEKRVGFGSRCCVIEWKIL